MEMVRKGFQKVILPFDNAKEWDAFLEKIAIENKASSSFLKSSY